MRAYSDSTVRAEPGYALAPSAGEVIKRRDANAGEMPPANVLSAIPAVANSRALGTAAASCLVRSTAPEPLTAAISTQLAPVLARLAASAR